ISRWSPTSRTASRCWRGARCWRRGTMRAWRRIRAWSKPISEPVMAEAAARTMAAPAALLTVEDLQGWYDESHVLHGVSFDVRPGEVVSLLGRNGAGKPTTLKAIMGILAKRSGSVRFDGRELLGLPP